MYKPSDVLLSLYGSVRSYLTLRCIKKIYIDMQNRFDIQIGRLGPDEEEQF